MLCITRKNGEEVFLRTKDGINITIKVLKISFGQNRITLGFDAPDDVIITRGELRDDGRQFAKK